MDCILGSDWMMLLMNSGFPSNDETSGFSIIDAIASGLIPLANWADAEPGNAATDAVVESTDWLLDAARTRLRELPAVTPNDETSESSGVNILPLKTRR